MRRKQRSAQGRCTLAMTIAIWNVIFPFPKLSTRSFCCTAGSWSINFLITTPSTLRALTFLTRRERLERCCRIRRKVLPLPGHHNAIHEVNRQQCTCR
ncbi:hypothetical protein SAICODRAFT_196410 [Saitoella complicata NRRL Y-17804]|uniref:uncharacterized protein n=1 Tax=Saitoella complicata (strain BCRC 22490 / CBS 7301 / JCM 7358 / NBRC 10748 / NRRL Y-17804) TaxID=698492 RepID=UPI0008673D60|nr:uncharacterized protein SAICODRAFT_196410 [Saitoella complicata NRRL Y-17804]ODQ54916.1 hypothetical protein SAICODRAFT_196410 [Saitoella complicata NRRL Y-17804]